MFWLFSIVGALLFAALMTVVFARLFGRGEQVPALEEFPSSVEPWRAVTQAPIAASSVRSVPFALAWRGYDQRQVDAYLERVAARLAELEASQNSQ